MKPTFAVLAVFLSAAVSSMAAPAQHVDRAPSPALITGMGVYSCGQFIEHKATNNAALMSLYLQWIKGFMVAYNVRSNFGKTWTRTTSGNLESLPDESTIYLYVEKHCNAHPLDTVLDATFSLVKDIGGEVIWKTYK